MSNLKKSVLGVLFLCLMGNVAWGQTRNNPYNDPRTKKDGYGLEDDSRPWFDGKDYQYFMDMFDGKSIKPQEKGTYQNFPKDSVPVKYELGKVKRIYEPFVSATTGEREIKPTNPTQPTSGSIVNGREMYNIYCAVCHGKDGNANTPVTKLGMPAPPIAGLLAVFSESHFYNKIRYGSKPLGIMPEFGSRTTRIERWDIVNYLKSPQFGKEDN